MYRKKKDSNCILLQRISTGILTFQFPRIKATKDPSSFWDRIFFKAIASNVLFDSQESRRRSIREHAHGSRDIETRFPFFRSVRRIAKVEPGDASRRREIESSRWKFAFVWVVLSADVSWPRGPCVRTNLYRFPYTSATKVIGVRWIPFESQSFWTSKMGSDGWRTGRVSTLFRDNDPNLSFSVSSIERP